MMDQTLFYTATGGYQEVPPDWMPATQTRPFVFEDPVVVWLEHHGKAHGFEPDASPYEFLDFIWEKGRQFETKWTREIAPGAVRVCAQAYDVRTADKVEQTFSLMQQNVPVIAQAALWWTPERIYGVPDFLVHTSWLQEKFPELFRELAASLPHYVVFDTKFTTKLDTTGKKRDLQNYAAQVRLYSFIAGHLQGVMPQRAYLISRDRISDPLPVLISSRLNQSLDPDLASMRDKFIEIKLNGGTYLPWQDEIVASNINHQDDRWRTAKNVIAWERVPGGDPGLLCEVSADIKQQLSGKGFPSLESMLKPDLNTIPFESCKGLGVAKSRRIRAILEANRSNRPVIPPTGLIPTQRTFEFYVDFEYLTNVNVDFERQWPTLEGCEMLFMVGVGWEEQGRWTFATFVASAEDQAREREMLESFLNFLGTKTNDAWGEGAQTALYHWSTAEVWQSRRAADRHSFPGNHPLRILPWSDLQQTFLNAPAALPGAWDFGLKPVAEALGKLNPQFETTWPGDLDEGLRAMVMGWKAYKKPNPLKSEEMNNLKLYLEADCKALFNILKWIRSGQ